MPSGSQHRKLTTDFLGWDVPEVHRLIDAAASYLGGRHRVVGHNLAMLRLVEELFGRPGRIVFTMHVLQDAGHFPTTTRRKPRKRRELVDELRLFDDDG